MGVMKMKKIDVAMKLIEMDNKVYHGLDPLYKLKNIEIYDIFYMFSEIDSTVQFLAETEYKDYFYDHVCDVHHGTYTFDEFREMLLDEFPALKNEIDGLEMVQVIIDLAEIEKKRTEVYMEFAEAGVTFDVFDRIEKHGVIDVLVNELIGDIGDTLYFYGDGEMSEEELRELLNEHLKVNSSAV
jgi:hypothetical protein